MSRICRSSDIFIPPVRWANSIKASSLLNLALRGNAVRIRSVSKKNTAEQIVNLLRQVEVGVANGKTLPQACKEAEIVEQTYYRWRKEYGGLKVDQARRLKDLEQENAKLKRLVSELSLEKLVLKEIASGNF